LCSWLVSPHLSVNLFLHAETPLPLDDMERTDVFLVG
jgi:hypothetical protein